MTELSRRTGALGCTVLKCGSNTNFMRSGRCSLSYDATLVGTPAATINPFISLEPDGRLKPGALHSWADVCVPDSTGVHVGLTADAWCFLGIVWRFDFKLGKTKMRYVPPSDDQWPPRKMRLELEALFGVLGSEEIFRQARSKQCVAWVNAPLRAGGDTTVGRILQPLRRSEIGYRLPTPRCCITFEWMNQLASTQATDPGRVAQLQQLKQFLLFVHKMVTQVPYAAALGAAAREDAPSWLRAGAKPGDAAAAAAMGNMWLIAPRFFSSGKTYRQRCQATWIQARVDIAGDTDNEHVYALVRKALKHFNALHVQPVWIEHGRAFSGQHAAHAAVALPATANESQNLFGVLSLRGYRSIWLVMPMCRVLQGLQTGQLTIRLHPITEVADAYKLLRAEHRKRKRGTTSPFSNAVNARTTFPWRRGPGPLVVTEGDALTWQFIGAAIDHGHTEFDIWGSTRRAVARCRYAYIDLQLLVGRAPNISYADTSGLQLQAFNASSHCTEEISAAAFTESNAINAGPRTFANLAAVAPDYCVPAEVPAMLSVWGLLSQAYSAAGPAALPGAAAAASDAGSPAREPCAEA